ncbi:protein of unknown function [Candidatus Methylocalor cossyra]|uniref:Uncharacterized protein n=1 Tax=Candidatus Methylocalor cossyra TaxID=3108543 RepID=A0ABM9NJX9_9GAMM
MLTTRTFPHGYGRHTAAVDQPGASGLFPEKGPAHVRHSMLGHERQVGLRAIPFLALEQAISHTLSLRATWPRRGSDAPRLRALQVPLDTVDTVGQCALQKTDHFVAGFGRDIDLDRPGHLRLAIAPIADLHRAHIAGYRKRMVGTEIVEAPRAMVDAFNAVPDLAAARQLEHPHRPDAFTLHPAPGDDWKPAFEPADAADGGPHPVGGHLDDFGDDHGFGHGGAPKL